MSIKFYPGPTNLALRISNSDRGCIFGARQGEDLKTRLSNLHTYMIR